MKYPKAVDIASIGRLATIICAWWFQASSNLHCKTSHTNWKTLNLLNSLEGEDLSKTKTPPLLPRELKITDRDFMRGTFRSRRLCSGTFIRLDFWAPGLLPPAVKTNLFFKKKLFCKFVFHKKKFFSKRSIISKKKQQFF